MRTAWKAWGPAVFWAAVLFLLSEIPDLPRGLDLPYLDKVGHFFLYGVLGLALGWGRRTGGSSAPHWTLLGVGWLYGALDEWHQSFVPGRTPDPYDFAVDVVGVVCGYLLLLKVTGGTSRTRGPSGGPEPEKDGLGP